MDRISKAILFGGKAIVSIVNATDICNKAIEYHGTSDGASEALGRFLAAGAFLSAGMKGADIKLSLSVEGDGSLGKIIVAGETGGIVRGYLENRYAKLPKKENGKYDIAYGVGKNGYISVIKDFGLKEPYLGRSSLVNGSIDADLAYYFTVSEQLPTAVASGSIVENGKCKSCGMILVQPMPNCEDEYITVLQDIVSNFTDFAQLLYERGIDDILDFYFGHFEISRLPDIFPKYECKCSKEKMDNVVLSLGEKEARSIINEIGMIEIHCDFCNTYYRYDKNEVASLFGGISGRNN